MNASYEFPCTVFTPTYNRAYTLKRVFDSLRQQTLKQEDGRPVFEWLIIDDGSTDETAELVRSFESHADFPMRYVFQENRGKHVAINRAVATARGELFIIADSDDAFVPEAIETFLRRWRALDEKQREEVYGINCLVRDGYKNQLIGRVPPGAPLVTDTNYMTYMVKHRTYFEFWNAFRTDVLKEFPFPEPEGARLVPLAHVWDDINYRYKALLVDDVLRIAYFEQDGFTKNPEKNFIRDARERYVFHLKRLNLYGSVFRRYDPVRYLKDLIQLGRMQFHCGYNALRGVRELKGLSALLELMVLPLSFFFYRRDRRRVARP